MNQILHIFRKDTRQHWIEIALSLAVTAAFFCVYPMQWGSYTIGAERNKWETIIDLLALLMPIAWGILTVRVTQAETVVGDRQFWITRPYEWKLLLSAKAFFLAVWIGLPFLLATAVLVHCAGFSAVASMPRLTLNALLTFGTFVLTVFALAAVVSSFARMTLTVLALLFLSVLLALLLSTVEIFSPSVPYSATSYQYPLLFAGCAACLVLAYATRRVWLTRGLLAAVPLVMLAAGFIVNSQSMVERSYPATALPLTTSLDVQGHCSTSYSNGSFDHSKHFDLMVRFAGMPGSDIALVEDYKFTLTAADGTQWTSPWQGLHETVLSRGESDCLGLRMPTAQYQRFSSGPVNIDLAFAGSRYEVASVATGAFPNHDGPVPNVGFCSVSPYFQSGALACRTGVHNLPPTRFRTAWINADCPAPGGPGCGPVTGGGWLQTSPGGGTLAGIHLNDANLSPAIDPEKVPGHWRVQPGTPLTVTQYRFVGRGRAELVIPNYQMPAGGSTSND